MWGTAYDIKCPGRLGSYSTGVCVPSDVAVYCDTKVLMAVNMFQWVIIQRIFKFGRILFVGYC